MKHKTCLVFIMCFLGIVLTGYAKKYKTIKVRGTIYYPLILANIEEGDYFDQPDKLIFTLVNDILLAADEQGGLFSFRKKPTNPNGIGASNGIGAPIVPPYSGIIITPLPVNGGDRLEIMEFFLASDVKIIDEKLITPLDMGQHFPSFPTMSPEFHLQDYLEQQDALQLGLQQQYQFLFEQESTIEFKQQVIEEYQTMQQLLQKDLYKTVNDLEGISRKDRRGLRQEYRRLNKEGF